MITVFLLITVALPILVALVLAVRPIGREQWIARIAQVVSAVSALSSVGAVALWAGAGGYRFATASHELFAGDGYQLRFYLVLDTLAAAFLLLVQFITSMVMRFSHFYMHREVGFQRFFATVLLFQGAMCLLTLGGNLQVMFAGWEIVGVASFLLIAFYRERQSAARNALKTYSVYRVADIGMLLAACLEGHGSHQQIGLWLLLAAIGKSAQFPFSFWIVRAMEGPTPSSALFYGGLSVHAGAYLLLRTYGMWEDATAVRVALGTIGLVTAVLSAMFSSVQSTIKAQIGYASVTQVGLIFVELALGLNTLALVHLVANALLRCYQLLVSPSAVAYLLRRHASTGAPATSEARSLYARFFSRRLRSTLYVFALYEGFLKEALQGLLWVPLRTLGGIALSHSGSVIVAGIIALSAPVLISADAPESLRIAVGYLLATVAVVFSSCGLAAWHRPALSYAWVGASSVMSAVAVFAVVPTHAGVASASSAVLLVAFSALAATGAARAVGSDAPISRFAGHSEAHPLAHAFTFVGALGIAGFPLLPTFLGEDLLLHATLPVSVVFSVAVAGLMALNGYVAVRTCAFTFFGRRILDDPSGALLPLTAAIHKRVPGRAVPEPE